MNRNDITEKIIATKVSKGITVGRGRQDRRPVSKEWTTALCLGQMTADAEQAKAVGAVFGLTRGRTEVAEGRAVQGFAADSGADRSADLPLVRDRQRVRHDHQGTDPRGIRRRHHERHRLQRWTSQREPDPKGDRVNVVLSGKFLPYKTY
jgi:cyanate lyase